MTTLPQTTNIRLPRPMGAAPIGVNGALGMPVHHAPAPTGMSGGDVWRVLRANVWLIIGIFVGSTVLGIALHIYLAAFHPRFTAVGYVQITTPNVINPFNLEARTTYVDNVTVQIEQRTHSQVLKDFSLHTRVLQDPNAAIRGTGWFKDYLIKQRQTDGTVREVLDDAEAKEDLKDNFDAIPIAESRLIKVQMAYKDPKDCRVIVDNIVSVYLEEQRKIMVNRTQERTSQLTMLKVKYENMIRQYRNDANMKLARLTEAGASVTPWHQSVREMEMNKYVEQATRLQAIYQEAKGQYDAAEEQIRRGESPPMVERMIEQDPSVYRLRGTLDDLDVQLAGDKARGGTGHWRVKQLEGQKEAVILQLEERKAEVRSNYQSQLLEQLQMQVKITQTDLDVVKQNIDRLKESLADAATVRAEYMTLKDEEENFREVLESVTKQLDTIQGQNQTSTSGIDWIQRPQTPDKKSFPSLPIVLSIAMGAGLALSLGIAFLREMLDTSVKSPRDIARVGQMNVLGMIPHDEDDPHSAGTPLPMVIFQAPHSMMAEQFRQVRTRLQHAASLDTTRSILVTSPSPGDGKSTVAVNLAAGLALNGRRILLVDANFRRPELHNIFSQPNDRGFGDVLNDVANFENALKQTQVPNLDILTSGQKPANATELLESQALNDFIERALEEYDHVIFDSGPMLFISETVALAPRVDGVVTVVRARSNSRGLLQRLRDALRQVKAEHLGVVLNGVKSQAGGYYGQNIRDYYEYQNGAMVTATATTSN